jgi:hypothetical protein
MIAQPHRLGWQGPGYTPLYERHFILALVVSVVHTMLKIAFSATDSFICIVRYFKILYDTKYII